MSSPSTWLIPGSNPTCAIGASEGIESVGCVPEAMTLPPAVASIPACEPPKVASALFLLLWVAVCTTGAIATADEVAAMPSPSHADR